MATGLLDGPHFVKRTTQILPSEQRGASIHGARSFESSSLRACKLMVAGFDAQRT